MKGNVLLNVIFVALLTIAATSCKRENLSPTPAVQLTDQDNGKTVTIAKGQTIKIVLGNPGDGGYTFDAPQFDNSRLILISHTQNAPANTNLIGNFGTDTWEFSGANTGASPVIISASRSFEKNSNVVMFSGTIVVD